MKETELDLLKFEDYSNQLVNIIQAQVHFENLIITKLETQNILNNKYFENNDDALKVAINLKDAWRFIFETYDLPLSTNYILQLHKILMDGLVDGNGYYRTRNVYVSGSKYIPPLLSQYQYKEMLEDAIKQDDLLSVPLLIAREQLFNDGNKRSATMLIQKALLAENKLFNLTLNNNNDYKSALLHYYQTKDKAPLEQFVKQNTIDLSAKNTNSLKRR
ncbi:Fic family protein [Mycoplasmopsis opalescens]|uniref:Fic family protein n=1 Tax=Mycoplasmopsis opalescens TaxID=114886 RepID=UPI0004A7089D|nr:Fic family protein [Mycoplasmopsis opalescens]